MDLLKAVEKGNSLQRHFSEARWMKNSRAVDEQIQPIDDLLGDTTLSQRAEMQIQINHRVILPLRLHGGLKRNDDVLLPVSCIQT